MKFLLWFEVVVATYGCCLSFLAMSVGELPCSVR